MTYIDLYSAFSAG